MKYYVICALLNIPIIYEEIFMIGNYIFIYLNYILHGYYLKYCKDILIYKTIH